MKLGASYDDVKKFSSMDNSFIENESSEVNEINQEFNKADIPDDYEKILKDNKVYYHTKSNEPSQLDESENGQNPFETNEDSKKSVSDYNQEVSFVTPTHDQYIPAKFEDH